LVERYSSQGRFYHTLEHIREMLEVLSFLKDLAGDFGAVCFAAWFHDSVYDTHASDNEEKSAAYAAQVLGDLGLGRRRPEEVCRLILLTKNHLASLDDLTGQVLLDADLAILGSAEERYDQYARAIRQEFAWVPNEDYRAGRTQVLSAFLRRERIYCTEDMRMRYESQARENLLREIRLMGKEQDLKRESGPGE
jgi:predicted metal-dependent HD superfamily phosphohydrolase